MGVKVNKKDKVEAKQKQGLAYGAEHIQWQKGLQGIRKRPEMYIHSVDSDGVWTLTREAGDNAADENGAGRNSFVHICQDTDDSIWVIDHGQGIPVAPYIDPETKKKDGRTTLEIILSETHAGGKFGSGAYKGSRGTHGVGVKATNALSSLFQVWTCFKGQWWNIEFSRGKLKKAPTKVSKPPKLPHGAATLKKGTVVRFIPDDQIFHKGSKFEPARAAEWCELTAYMQAGFVVKLTDKKGKTKEWCFKNGSKEYLDRKIKKLEANQLGKDCLIQEGCYNIAVAFTDYDGIALAGFTNGLSNPDGGTHIDTFYKALAKSLEAYKGKSKYNPSDLREGIIGFINVRLDEPKFGSQTKEKLVDETPTKQYAEVLKGLTKFFDNNKGLAKKLTQRAAELKGLKDQFADNKKVLKELSGAARKGKSFASKHARCDCAPELRELFLVEGESASGTAKQGRNPAYQEILPLKGKILNVMKGGANKKDKAFDSEEVMNILIGIGYDPSSKAPLDNLRVGKLILLADPDPDGRHINTLELTLFAKYLAGIYQKGTVYIINLPEYVMEHGGKNYFGDSPKDVEKSLPKGVKLKNVQHLKGLGEMTALQLRELAFNPDTRKLLKVAAPSKEDMKEFSLLMSDNTDYRRKLLGV